MKCDQNVRVGLIQNISEGSNPSVKNYNSLEGYLSIILTEKKIKEQTQPKYSSLLWLLRFQIGFPGQW